MLKNNMGYKKLKPDKEAFKKLIEDFDDAFSRGDLDGMMSYIDEDAFYDEYSGLRHHGKAAIRNTFEPQLRGDFGRMIFHKEDMFVEAFGPGDGKVMYRWLLTIEQETRAGGWRGMDVYRFENGKLKEMHTYAKTRSPLVEKKSESERVRRAIDEGVLIEL